MAKTSKIVPQKEVASSSRLAGGEDAAEPRPEEFIPVGCSTVSDFKVEKPSSVSGRFVARMPEPIPDLKQWVEGLGKDVAMRPPSGDEEVPVPKQVKEKNRKDSPRSPFSKKKKPAKKYRKLKGGPSVMLPESIHRLRDEPEEVEKELAGVRANVVIQQSSESAEVNKGTLAIIPEQEKIETIRSRAGMVEGETEGRTSRAAKDISRDELGIVDVSGSPQISDAMICEDSMMEGRSYEGIQESTDIHSFLDGLESAASEEASVLHHEAFLRIREENEAEVRELTEKSDSYKLLSEKLQADLAAARDEHEEMGYQVFRILHDSKDELEITTDNPILQVRQRLEQIGRLNLQVDELMAEWEKFKENMDILASKKEAVQAQLESAEAQLRAVKENTSVQIERVKELQSRLDLSTSDKESLANELEVVRSEVTEANKRADAKVAQFRNDVEVNQAKAKSMVEHAKWKAQREDLEEVSAQGFDVEAEIENAKAEKNRARRLAFPEEDSNSSNESEGEEDPEDVVCDEDQAI
ncbi:uncharacterized protein [Nicotiana tomentosiformis]|uniref:uncharacterized protein n=1 Tax=Nicotiana tomentosiformis TaxID=4098 RepID=UPI00388C3CB4